MTQSRESIPLAFFTQKACQQSNQLGSEQERAADLRNSMLCRLQDAASIEPPVQLKKKVPLLRASVRLLRRELTSGEADALEGGPEHEGLAHQVPQQGAVAEEQVRIDLSFGRTGENDGPTVVESWIELKRPATATYASSACSACGPDTEHSTETNS